MVSDEPASKNKLKTRKNTKADRERFELTSWKVTKLKTGFKVARVELPGRRRARFEVTSLKLTKFGLEISRVEVELDIM